MSDSTPHNSRKAGLELRRSDIEILQLALQDSLIRGNSAIPEALHSDVAPLLSYLTQCKRGL